MHSQRLAVVLSPVLASLAASGCTTDPVVPPPPERVSIEGDLFAFLTEVDGPRISGATVSILEHPEKTVVTGADAHFRFDDLEEGSAVTLVASHPDFKTSRTATVTLGARGVQPFSVQMVPTGLFNALAAIVPMPPELDKYCAIASTVARMGGSLFVHLRQGMPGVTVQLTPAVPQESGPIYFDEQVLPNVAQKATTIDGGVLFYRVPPGDYTMTASRGGATFNQVKIRCEAGVIVNAGPPLGLLANVAEPDYASGGDRADDAFSAASDALCEKTAACVNEKAMATNYPPVTVASCKANYDNTWAHVDVGCDASSHVRDAARALYACRAADCALALGDDTACAAEDAAFRAAEDAYGACLTTRSAN